MKPSGKRIFETRHAALRHIANLSPNRVGVADIADLTDTHIRTAQRALRDLADWGYLISDGCNPVGYKFNEDKREAVWL